MPISIAPTLTPASGTVSAPFSVTFAVAPSGGAAPYTYDWRFGDGNVSSSDTGTHTYIAGRSYPVSLTVRDALGDSATWSTTYVVNPALEASFTAVVTVGPGSANSVAFTSTASLGTAPYTYAWAFGDGATSTAANPSHVYDEAGSYLVTLIVTDADNHTVRLSQQVGITNLMTVTVTAVPVTGSEPLVVNFTALATAGSEPYVYTWDFGDGEINSGASVSHTYTEPGIYEVKVGVVDALLHDTGGSVVVNVLDPLKSDPDRYPAKSVVPFPVTFYSNAVGGVKPYQYLWDFGDGFTSTEINPVHNYTVPGYYNVALTVTDNQGRVFTTYVAVDAGDPAPPAISITIYLDDVTIYGNPFTIFRY